MKKRTNKLPAWELSRLMCIRDVYHECGKNQSVCVVLPDNKTEEEVFGSYLPAIRQRMRRNNVWVTSISDLDGAGLEMDCIIDLTVV